MNATFQEYDKDAYPKEIILDFKKSRKISHFLDQIDLKNSKKSSTSSKRNLRQSYLKELKSFNNRSSKSINLKVKPPKDTQKSRRRKNSFQKSRNVNNSYTPRSSFERKTRNSHRNLGESTFRQKRKSSRSTLPVSKSQSKLERMKLYDNQRRKLSQVHFHKKQGKARMGSQNLLKRVPSSRRSSSRIGKKARLSRSRSTKIVSSRRMTRNLGERTVSFDNIITRLQDAQNNEKLHFKNKKDQFLKKLSEINTKTRKRNTSRRKKSSPAGGFPKCVYKEDFKRKGRRVNQLHKSHQENREHKQPYTHKDVGTNTNRSPQNANSDLSTERKVHMDHPIQSQEGRNTNNIGYPQGKYVKESSPFSIEDEITRLYKKSRANKKVKFHDNDTNGHLSDADRTEPEELFDYLLEISKLKSRALEEGQQFRFGYYNDLDHGKSVRASSRNHHLVERYRNQVLSTNRKSVKKQTRVSRENRKCHIPEHSKPTQKKEKLSFKGLRSFRRGLRRSKSVLKNPTSRSPIFKNEFDGGVRSQVGLDMLHTDELVTYYREVLHKGQKDLITHQRQQNFIKKLEKV